MIPESMNYASVLSNMLYSTHTSKAMEVSFHIVIAAFHKWNGFFVLTIVNTFCIYLASTCLKFSGEVCSIANIILTTCISKDVK